MEIAASSNSQQPAVTAEDANQHTVNTTSDGSDHGDVTVTTKIDISSEEMRSLIEAIAASGKFWHDWSFLRNVLSLRMKQVLAEYPEGQSLVEVEPQQSSSSGEAFSELAKRLDDALMSFEEGPPFTLQRICEILLYPKSTYTKLSKLAFALEKNLLVTSILTRCTDLGPDRTEHKINGGARVHADAAADSSTDSSVPASNGLPDPATEDQDEEMPDAEMEEVSPDTEMNEDGHVESAGAEHSAEPITVPTIPSEAEGNGDHPAP